MSHFDVTADNRDDVVARLATMVLDAPADVFDAGRWWYHEAHDGAAEVARALGVSRRQAAGIIAVLSPGVEAEVQNLDLAFAVGEATWDITRIPTVLRRAPRRSLVKALRMRDGEDPAVVLNPRTGPKTWAFFWNIHAPTLRERVTVDGRHADIIVNEMRGWKLKRGIDVGGPGSRYESYEHVTEDAASWLRRKADMPWMTAVQTQAIAWCHAKAIEQVGLTTRGNARKQGPSRRGQRYVP